MKLEEAIEERKRLLSCTKNWALEFESCFENSSCINIYNLIQQIELVPIQVAQDFVNVGNVVDCILNAHQQVWKFPDGCKFLFEAPKFNLVENQKIHLSFRLVLGDARDHVKFCKYNSIGIEKMGQEYFLKIEQNEQE